MKIATKITVNIFLFVLFSLVMFTAFAVMTSRVDKSLRNDIIVNRIVSGVNDLNTATYGFVLRPDERPRMQWELKHASLGRLIQTLETGETILLERIARNHGLSKNLFEKLIHRSSVKNYADLEPITYDEDGQRVVAQLIARTQMIATDAALLTQASTASIVSLNRKSLYVVFGMTLLMSGVITFASLVLRRRIAESFRQMNEGTRIIAAGNLQHRIDMSANDEIGELARAFDLMSGKLETTTVSVDALSREVQERKRAEEEVSEQREWLRVTLSSIGDAVIATDSSGLVAFLNPVGVELTGWQAEEALGQPVQSVFQVINEVTRQPAENIVDRVLREGVIVNLANHTALVTRDGYEIPIEDSAAPIRDSDGNLIGVVLVFHSVTEKRRAEEALLRSHDELEFRVRERTAELESANETLREQSRLLEAFFQHTITPLGFLDRDFNFKRVNEAYARADGRTPQQFIGCNHFDLYPSDARPIFQEVVNSKKPYRAIARPFVYAHHPERGITYWDWLLVPLLDHHGEVDSLVYSLNDVTEQKRAELAIQESEKLLRSVLEALPVGVWIVDKTGRIVNGNPAGQKIWGGSKHVPIEEYGEYKGWWADSGEPVKHEEWAAARAITRGETSIDELVEIECFDGTHKFILNSAVPLEDEGRIRGAIIVNQDISNRVEMERELRAYANRLEIVNRELQEFAFIASHDLQEPLRKIQSFGDMLRTRCGEELGETGANYLMRMEKAAARMRQLIQDLLEFSRVATKPEPYKAVDLNEILQEVIQVFELSSAKIGARIEFTDLPVIEADETQLKQLFQNLIGNALKYRRADVVPEIRIRCVREGQKMWRIIVEDNGIGFDPAFAQKIFAPFQRLHPRGEFEGTGMGLAICRKIVERHGGDISASSQPGKGSMFIINLPAQQIGCDDIQ